MRTRNTNLANNVGPQPSEIVEALVTMVQDRCNNGFTPYLLTVMFKQIPGTPRTRLEVMRCAIEKVYAHILTRICRNPRTAWPDTDMPLWICLPDLPVQKHKRDPIQLVRPNDGLHFHIMALIPPQSRMSVGLDDYISDNQAMLVSPPVFEIDARPIKCREDGELERVTRYALKSLERRRITSDDLIVLPKSRTELPAPAWR